MNTREVGSYASMRAERGGQVAQADVLSVEALDRLLRAVVEGATRDVWVGGEVTGLRVVGSGHAYFTLKDEHADACIDCVMYRGAPVRARKLLAEGARLVLGGRATVYAPRGRLQLVAERARPAGRGALLEALERLKNRLAKEGLFDAARKRALPGDPRIIGVVTSADGAAIHDIVKVAFQRGGARILLASAPVQGPTAPPRMVRALGLLERMPEVDVIVIGRGGGSVDDLAAYNDEALVRKIAQCRVPVVSAVGHETDVSLTDLVADARAATPSHAAEILIVDASARRHSLEQFQRRLESSMTHRFGEHRRALAEDAGRVASRASQGIRRHRAGVAAAERRLVARHPSSVLAAARARIGPLAEQLTSAISRRMARARTNMSRDVARLDALSPLSVLSRGYAIATTGDGRAVRDARRVKQGDELSLRVHRGSLVARVIAVDPGQDPVEGEVSGAPTTPGSMRP